LRFATKTRPALRLSGTKNLHFATAPFPRFSAEETSNTAFTVLNHESPENYFAKMHHLFFPSWAIKSLIS
ncbi:hypothetical protein, partial [Methylomonas methanica]|uniref:hypothetical protein n=1 Tax=Methylomonas methanica TaxID=421 RepID=UPI001A9F20A4